MGQKYHHPQNTNIVLKYTSKTIHFLKQSILEQLLYNNIFCQYLTVFFTFLSFIYYRFQNNKKMIRLFIKIHQVALRLREEVQVQCQIRKGHQYCLYPEQCKLKRGKAIFRKQMELYMENSEPQFEIQVILIFGNTKKLGGLCSINLKQWEQNSCHQSSYQLQKSPDSKAHIEFDFLFMHTTILPQQHSLFSSTQYEEQKKRKILLTMQNENKLLSSENSRLSLEIKQLKERNNFLSSKQSQLQAENQKDHKKFQKEINQKNQIIMCSENNLVQMRGKLERMREMVRNYGEDKLRNTMENIIQEKSWQQGRKKIKKEENNEHTYQNSQSADIQAK